MKIIGSLGNIFFSFMRSLLFFHILVFEHAHCAYQPLKAIRRKRVIFLAQDGPASFKYTCSERKVQRYRETMAAITHIHTSLRSLLVKPGMSTIVPQAAFRTYEAYAIVYLKNKIFPEGWFHLRKQTAQVFWGPWSAPLLSWCVILSATILGRYF